jgi:myo-inositol-1(or 4)-monophosphatase
MYSFFVRKAVLKEVLLACGEAIKKTRDLKIEEKLSSADLLTNADLASERAAAKIIHDKTGDELLSEEDPKSHEKAKDPQWSGWVIDPIDGTLNFARAIPYYSVSVAYIENGEPIVGGIFDPVHDEMWLAEKDKGATRNEEKIHVSRKESIDSGTRVCSSTSYEAGLTIENIKRYEKLGDVWVDFLSSAALDFAYIADGRIDIFHHNGLKPWDNAAGFLLVKEAGGIILRFDGSDALWHEAEMVAANPALAREFLRKID